MSTRATITIKEGEDQMHFYRHSDGYPEGAMPVLEEYMAYVKEGALRSDVMQSAGWLIILGHQEYVREQLSPEKPEKAGYSGWKCGSIEPLPQGVYPEDIGDAEHHYILDIENKTITHIKL